MSDAGAVLGYAQYDRRRSMSVDLEVFRPRGLGRGLSSLVMTAVTPTLPALLRVALIEDASKTMTVSFLLQADMTKLCTAVRTAWRRLEPGETSAPFTWRGVPYDATQTSVGLRVETPKGCM